MINSVKLIIYLNYKPSNTHHRDENDVNDTVEVIVRNLTEMNKLWIRMQGKDKSKKEKERLELKVTVAENLTRLSSLECVTLDL